LKEPHLSKAETRILEQYWKLGTAPVREVLESLPEDERVADTTVQTLVYLYPGHTGLYSPFPPLPLRFLQCRTNEFLDGSRTS
jgi:hypothetical protein